MKRHYDFGQEIMRRKNLLLRRDPLAKKLTSALGKYIHKKKEAKNSKEIEDELNKLTSLERQIEKKWGGSVYIPEALLRGILPVETWVLSAPISRIGRAHQVYPRYVGKDAQGRDIIWDFQTIKEESSNGPLNYVGSPDDLLIRVNSSIIDSHDAKELKRKFWSIIEDDLKKRKRHKKPNDLQLRKELHWLYHRKQETFDKYLNWYDIHTQENLGFRLIAHFERIRRKDAIEGARLLETLKYKKIRWGIPIKGEDNVEKAVKTIHKIIHRKRYSKPPKEIEQYHCPEHGNECPPSCSYLKKFMGKFNRIFSS